MYFFIQKLTELHLGWNLIRDEGACHLAEALKQNEVKCILSSHLCHYDLLFFIQILTKLDIGGNQIGEKGAQYLADALKGNEVRYILSTIIILCAFFTQVLIEFDVDGNEIGDEGAKCLIQVHRILRCLFSLAFTCFRTGTDQ
jgi:Ran GTPase-activating protein (RanGAP) involved in mRNA processing and transport